MATVEELLETLISVQEETQGIEETQSSDIQVLTSQIEILTSDMVVLKEQSNILSSGQVDETTPNYLLNGLNLINASQGAYTSDQVLENNELYFKDIRGINEMITYQFIFMGVIIAFFIVVLIIKGFFKSVSN